MIIPCFNEEHRFKQEHFLDYFHHNPAIDFCLVNDGSTDGTEKLLAQLRKVDEKRICCYTLEKNTGKAEAIRQALLYLSAKNGYDYIGYIDADFAAPLTQINHILSYFNGHLTHSIIAGSRVKRLGATIKRSSSRHYLGRVFATVASVLLRLPIYDSQCGLKLIEAQAAKELFAAPFKTKWLFDLELWFRLRNLVGIEKILLQTIEVPLNDWQEKSGSKIKFKHMLSVPVDLFRIHKAYNRTYEKQKSGSHKTSDYYLAKSIK